MASRPMTEAELSRLRTHARQIALIRLGANHPRLDVLTRQIIGGAMAFDAPDPIRPAKLQRHRDGWPVYEE